MQLPLRSMKVEFGSDTETDVTHYWIAVGGSTVWRRVLRNTEPQHERDRIEKAQADLVAELNKEQECKRPQ